MATIIERDHTPSAARGEGFYWVMAVAMSVIIVAGFALNLAMGRSTFAVPPVYHVHAGIFFGWVALYLAQAWSITSGRIELHIARQGHGLCQLQHLLHGGIKLDLERLVAGRTQAVFLQHRHRNDAGQALVEPEHAFQPQLNAHGLVVQLVGFEVGVETAHKSHQQQPHCQMDTA